MEKTHEYLANAMCLERAISIQRHTQQPRVGDFGRDMHQQQTELRGEGEGAADSHGAGEKLSGLDDLSACEMAAAFENGGEPEVTPPGGAAP